jgi:streptomycin 6-kinase
MSDQQMMMLEVTAEEQQLIELVRQGDEEKAFAYLRALVAVAHMPSRDALLAMSAEERTYWLKQAAIVAEPLYRNDPELTITADTIDLYDDTL